MNDVRLLPLVIAAAGALLLLKAAAAGLGGSGVPVALAQDAEQAGEPADAGALETEPRSSARDAVMESLGERRRELEAREEELQLRENLLAATEARLDERLEELRSIEARIEGAAQARRDEEDERFAGLVQMYETMRPKDAAGIFNGLEMPILVRVASRMQARAMSEVLAQMEPRRAQELTVELSGPAEPAEPGLVENGELPQIIGTRP